MFEDAAVDAVILEVGMGGLDATNVVPTSTVLCSVLVAVYLDHQAFLGTTVAQIARHKAGIARPGRPFVLGPQDDDSIQQVVEEVVLHTGGTLLRSPRVHADNGNSSVHLGSTRPRDSRIVP
jgi:folylpolyglutamate synthase/dihydropteroate synthase